MWICGWRNTTTRSENWSQDGCGDPVRVQRIGLPDPVPGPGVRPCGFGDRVSGAADSTGQQGAV